ncbi:hypothetical protein DPEC_G00158650 [Dallia pectoralis]|uniref:Uncharacterized protein n=1 Tax=Dallia pectoralis TaxID=75939 RepID=A0ACC2GFU7_DALPE|nr:hypothetical protein DPEC_G00158650 [Dallia pectoralis]
MDTDVMEIEVGLKGAGDPDTPSTYDGLGGDIRDTQNPSSSVESGEEEEGLEELQHSRTKLSLEIEEAAGGALQGPTQTGEPPQETETETPDNRKKQAAELELACCSAPVRIRPTYSNSGQYGSWEHQESVSSTEARLRMEGVELKEEWQDEDFPRPLPEEEEDIRLNEDLFVETSRDRQSGGKKAMKKLSAPDISLTLDRSDGSLLSDHLEGESTELDLDDIDTPSDNSNEFEWEDDLPKLKRTEVLQNSVGSVQEYSASEEREEVRRWRVFRIGDQDHRVDMKAIEPYKRVISHGGYYGDGLNAIIVFAVCYMPESDQRNYRYIMDNIFKYVIGTLELLVAENYMIVYLNGTTSRKQMPSVGWLRKCYQQIDRRLRKNLKSLIIVHPSWFIRTLLALTKPFISSKFSQKIQFVFSLNDLSELVPMEYVSIPDCIKELDKENPAKVEMAAAALPEAE